MLVLYILIARTLSEKLVEYKFYKNYGEIFYDYSGNARHGVNGDSENTDSHEMISTDRGIYSSGGSKRITLPPNNIQTTSFDLPSSFSILFWRKWFQESSRSIYTIFDRQSSFFQLSIERITQPNSFEVQININNCQTKKYHIPSDDSPYIWNLMIFQIKIIDFYFYAGSTLLDSKPLSCSYFESSSTPKTTTIGSTSSSSFIGFIWNFLILDEFVDRNYYMLVGASKKCFVGTCSCSIQVIDSELGTGCIKSDDNIGKNSVGNICDCGLEVSCSPFDKTQCYSCNCNPNSCFDFNGVRKCMMISSVSCQAGYYLPEGESNCQACHSDCSECSEDLICDECLSANAIPSPVKGCICPTGTYTSSSLSSEDSLCSSCHIHCETCSKEAICTKCKALKAEPDIKEGCKCPDYFFLNILIESQECSACPSSCSSCTGKEYFECLACDFFLVDQICFMMQPLGYACNDLRVCQALKPAALSFSFEGSGRNYFESLSGGVAKVDYDGKVHIAGTMDRGVYLFGTRGLEVSVENLTMLGTEFSFSVWINTNLSDFTLIEKKLESTVCVQVAVLNKKVKLITLIDSVSFTSRSTKSIEFSTWNHLLIVLEYFKSSSKTRFYINRVEEPSVEISQKPFVAVDNSSLFIGSAMNWTNGFKGFIFKFELYVLDPGVENLVDDKVKSCSIVPASQDCIPLCNLTQYSDEDSCKECPSGCINGCKNNLTCNLCTDENCLECSTFNEKSCSICDENWIVKENLCHKCENSTYYKNASCVPCEGLCLTCESKSICTSCKNLSSLEASGLCSCDQGYQKVSDNCTRIFFSLKFGVFQNNTIWLSFNESLILKKDQINVKLSPNKLKDINLVKIESFLYNLELNFKDDIDSETSAKIKFIKEVISTKNSLLLSKSFKINLFQTTNIKNNNDIKHEMEEARNNARTTAYLGASAALAASLLSGDLNSVFTFLNIAEMIYAVYFFNLELYPPFAEFVLGLRVHSSIPNMFSFFIPESTGVALPSKYHKYGFKTNIFMLNCGIQLTLAAVFFVAFLVLTCLTKFKKFKKFALEILKRFKYGIFLRILIQSFFDLLLACAFGLEYREFSSFIQGFNFLICFAFVVKIMQAFQVFCMCSVFIILKRLMNSYSITSQTDLKIKFSLLFDEFREGSISYHFYYCIFMFRRLLLVFVIKLKCDPYIQLILAAVAALTVCIYVFSTKCFKKDLMNALNTIIELLISVYYFVLLFKFLPEANTSWKNAGKYCINIIFTIWAVNIFISLCIAFVNIYQKATNICKTKIQVKIAPMTEAKASQSTVIFTRQ